MKRDPLDDNEINNLSTGRDTQTNVTHLQSQISNWRLIDGTKSPENKYVAADHRIIV